MDIQVLERLKPLRGPISNCFKTILKTEQKTNAGVYLTTETSFFEGP